MLFIDYDPGKNKKMMPSFTLNAPVSDPVFPFDDVSSEEYSHRDDPPENDTSLTIFSSLDQSEETPSVDNSSFGMLKFYAVMPPILFVASMHAVICGLFWLFLINTVSRLLFLSFGTPLLEWTSSSKMLIFLPVWAIEAVSISFLYSFGIGLSFHPQYQKKSSAARVIATPKTCFSPIVANIPVVATLVACFYHMASATLIFFGLMEIDKESRPIHLLVKLFVSLTVGVLAYLISGLLNTALIYFGKYVEYCERQGRPMEPLVNHWMVSKFYRQAGNSLGNFAREVFPLLGVIPAATFLLFIIKQESVFHVFIPTAFMMYSGFALTATRFIIPTLVDNLRVANIALPEKNYLSRSDYPILRGFGQLQSGEALNMLMTWMLSLCCLRNWAQTISVSMMAMAAAVGVFFLIIKNVDDYLICQDTVNHECAYLSRFLFGDVFVQKLAPVSFPAQVVFAGTTAVVFCSFWTREMCKRMPEGSYNPQASRVYPESKTAEI